MIKRRRLKIDVLKNENDVWIDDPNELKNIVLYFFKNLFANPIANSLAHWCNKAVFKLFKEDNKVLNRVIIDTKIKKAMNNIKACKVPGRDDFQAIFYHKYWDIVGADVCSFVNSCVATHFIPEEINRTLIALIPKVSSPERVKQFRHINLCNVTYKVITKLLVDRLRPFLDNIVRPNQSSFILSRNTSDNIIIIKEAIHTMHHLKGKSGSIVMKIDLKKAYDNIS